MNLNITLCIQCLNFFITYLFLRYAFFKPVMKIIRNEENKNAEGLYAISQHQLYISDQQHTRQLHWQEFKTHCQFNKPALEQTVYIPEPTLFTLPKVTINSTLIDTMSNEYAKIIVEHLKNRNLAS